MAHILKPFRSYNENDVINLFAFDGAIGTDGVVATAGTVVKVTGVGFQPKTDAVPVDMAGAVGQGYANVVSDRYALTAKVANATLGDSTPLGITLMATQELDENGEKLVFNPRKAAEKGVVVSGQAVPVLTRGIVTYSGSNISNSAIVGAGVYTAANGELSTTNAGGSVKVGTLLSVPVNNTALIKLNF